MPYQFMVGVQWGAEWMPAKPREKVVEGPAPGRTRPMRNYKFRRSQIMK